MKISPQVSVGKSSVQNLYSKKTVEAEAHQAMALYSLPQEDHVLLHENLSQYLFNLQDEIPWDSFQSPQEATNWIGALGKELAKEKSESDVEQMRWPKKILRELNQPYRDSDMADIIDKNQRDFRKSVKKIRAAYPHEEFTFFLAGSPIYGRFGGNSDIDAYTKTVDDKTDEIFDAASIGEVHVGKFPLKTYVNLPCSPDFKQLPQDEPWEQLDDIIIDSWAEKGIVLNESGQIFRNGLPPRQRDRAWMDIPESCPVEL